MAQKNGWSVKGGKLTVDLREKKGRRLAYFISRRKKKH